MLKLRIITALVLAPIVLLALFKLAPSHFAIFVGVIVTLGAWEWAPLMSAKTKVQRVLLAAVVAGLTTLMANSLFHPGLTQLADPVLAKAILYGALLWWLVASMLVLTYPQTATVWKQSLVIRAVFAFLALLPTWLAFVLLRGANYPFDEMYGAWLVCYVFGIVWAADIGAYFVGKSMGKRKLMPKVSPGKTIEGLAGGLCCSGVFALIVAYGMDFDATYSMKLVAISVVVALMSAFGDLTESMLKREAGIKDSGSILPGHGGVLDRIDSLLAAMPIFALAYFEWLN